MVTTHRSIQSNQRQTRAKGNHQKKNKRKKQFNFQEYDDILTSLRRKTPKQTSAVVEKLVDRDNDIDISKRPIRKATKAALQSCRGSSSDTTANKINPYYLIG